MGDAADKSLDRNRLRFLRNFHQDYRTVFLSWAEQDGIAMVMVDHLMELQSRAPDLFKVWMEEDAFRDAILKNDTTKLPIAYGDAPRQPISKRVRFALDDSVHRFAYSWEEQEDKKRAWNLIAKRVNQSYADQFKEERRKKETLERAESIAKETWPLVLEELRSRRDEVQEEAPLEDSTRFSSSVKMEDQNHLGSTWVSNNGRVVRRSARFLRQTGSSWVRDSEHQWVRRSCRLRGK
jgi:hypothetical protein